MVWFSKNVGEEVTPLFEEGKTSVSKRALKKKAPVVHQFVDHFAKDLDFYSRNGQWTVRSMPELKEKGLTHKQKIWRHAMKFAQLDLDMMGPEDKIAWTNVVKAGAMSWRDYYFSRYLKYRKWKGTFPNVSYLQMRQIWEDGLALHIAHREMCYCDMYYSKGVAMEEDTPYEYFYEAWQHRGLKGSGKLKPYDHFQFIEAGQPDWDNYHRFFFPNINPGWYPFFFLLITFNSVGEVNGWTGLYVAGKYFYFDEEQNVQVKEVGTFGYRSIRMPAGIFWGDFPEPDWINVEPNVWEK